MNIGCLRDYLHRIEEIKVIGKNAIVDGVVCNIMGLVRHGREMRLLMLQYDESFRQKIEQSEAEELPDAPVMPESNRMFLRGQTTEPKNPFRSVLKVFIGESEFKVDFTELRRLGAQDWEHLLLVARFLENGWQPDGIDHQDVDLLFLASLKLFGDYNSIPEIGQDPQLRFVMGPYNVTFQVEKPVELVIGGRYPDKLIFQDAVTGVEHWVHINRVYLMDMWEEAERIFSASELREKMAPDEIDKARQDFEKRLAEICPRGMCFPVVEYECEEEISLQFHTRSYLDAKPVHRNSGMAILSRPEQPSGVLGFKLKASVIQEPVPANTVKIDAELFQYHRIITRDDILL